MWAQWALVRFYSLRSMLVCVCVCMYVCMYVCIFVGCCLATITLNVNNTK